MTGHGYPFTAIVGQPQMRLALILLAISPGIGGVLIRGEKGTAKSTVARSLAGLLPSGRMRTLALGTTEDRLLGGLDLEATITAGEPKFQPGLLASCDGGIVYIDEVNLLDAHLAGLILDAAAGGLVRVEREGLSLQQPASFALIGTMNPEEGGLGPQLLDRFGLCIDVRGETDPQLRVEILRRRLAHDADPDTFWRDWAAAETALAKRLALARAAVAGVVLDDRLTEQIARLCAQAGVAGHRADLVFAAATRAHAAWQGRDQVYPEDVAAVSEMVLVHRRRHLDEPPAPSPPPVAAQPSRAGQPADQPERDPADEPGPGSPAHDVLAEIGDPFRVRQLAPGPDRRARLGAGRRQQSISADRRGHVISVRPATHPTDLALAATIRAAAPHQLGRQATLPDDDPRRSLRVIINSNDWQGNVRRRRVGSCVVLLVDASGSMGARNRMVASKGAVLSLLLDAYVRRDRVALVSFRDTQAEVLVGPTASIELARDRLQALPIGGRTPLAAGLLAGLQVVRPLLLGDPRLRPLIVVLTDGRGNMDLDGRPARGATKQALRVAARLTVEEPRVGWVVVDSEPAGIMNRGHAHELAAALSAQYFTIDNLRADDLLTVVRTAQAQWKEAT